MTEVINRRRLISSIFQVGKEVHGAAVHRVHRFHTVCPPSKIKWESVFAFNCGLNIV